MMFGWLSVALASPAGLADVVEFRVKDTDDVLRLRAPTDEFEDHVVGGRQAEQGEWDDAVGIVFDGAYVGCTGTLVAPNVVITAAHCAGNITHVLVGSKNWGTDQGEALEVRDLYVHQSYDGYDGYDFAALRLRGQSSYPHRIIANDCILEEELFDGQSVTITGFGNTSANGGGGTTRLMTADSIVRDSDCSRDVIGGIYTGCLPSLRPGGEIAAGGRVDVDGDGDPETRDACFGDSGGPLYLNTARGTFVVGVTSRAFIGVDPNFPCRDGGIWVRPDAVMRFIENRTGVTLERPQCNEAPVASAADIKVKAGKTGRSEVLVEDIDGESFTLEIASEPTLGTATIEDNQVVFTAFDGARGAETVMVAVTDDGHPVYEGSPPITIEIPVEVIVRKKGLLGLGFCGCQTGSGYSLGLGMLVGLLGLARRRRR